MTFGATLEGWLNGHRAVRHSRPPGRRGNRHRARRTRDDVAPFDEGARLESTGAQRHPGRPGDLQRAVLDTHRLARGPEEGVQGGLLDRGGTAMRPGAGRVVRMSAMITPMTTRAAMLAIRAIVYAPLWATPVSAFVSGPVYRGGRAGGCGLGERARGPQVQEGGGDKSPANSRCDLLSLSG